MPAVQANRGGARDKRSDHGRLCRKKAQSNFGPARGLSSACQKRVRTRSAVVSTVWRYSATALELLLGWTSFY